MMKKKCAGYFVLIFSTKLYNIIFIIFQTNWDIQSVNSCCYLCIPFKEYIETL